MPTVAIVGTRGYPSFYGGFETLLRVLVPYLIQKGWDITVYGRRGHLAATEDENGCGGKIRSVTTLGFESKSLSTLSYGLTATAHSAFRGADVALVMNVANGFWLPMLKVRGVPTVVNVDGIEWERAKWGASAKRVFRAGARLTARLADTVVCDSVAIADYWERVFGRDSVFIPYGGTDPGEPDPVPGFERGSYALMVARFVPENTVPEFLSAARSISRTHKVVIVGSSGYGGELDLLAESLDGQYENICWLGHMKDDKKLFALWSNAGAYFHGHSVGGTNPALVQAMACGAPTLARDTVYNREVLGDAGVFVAPESSAIANGMTRLLLDQDLAVDMGRKARNRQRNHYSWSAICESYHKALMDTL